MNQKVKTLQYEEFKELKSEFNKLIKECSPKFKEIIQKFVDFRSNYLYSSICKWANECQANGIDFQNIKKFNLDKNFQEEKLVKLLIQYYQYVLGERLIFSIFDNINSLKLLSYQIYYFYRFNSLLFDKEKCKLELRRLNKNYIFLVSFYQNPISNFFSWLICDEIGQRLSSENYSQHDVDRLAKIQKYIYEKLFKFFSDPSLKKSMSPNSFIKHCESDKLLFNIIAQIFEPKPLLSLSPPS